MLIAASDKNFNGMQSMDEFMDMVFNTSDALEVDLQALKDIGSEQECQQLMDRLNQASSQQAQERHLNQLSNVLKQSVSGMQQQMLAKDPSLSGKMTGDQFMDQLKALRF